MIKRWRDSSSIGGLLATILFLAGAASALHAAQEPELMGILTQVTGTVQLTGPGVTGDPLASTWQVIRVGVTIRVPQGGSAGILCSTCHFVRLSGPETWLLSEKACEAGEVLTPAEYRLVAPRAGRFKVVEGLQVLERENLQTWRQRRLASYTDRGGARVVQDWLMTGLSLFEQVEAAAPRFGIHARIARAEGNRGVNDDPLAPMVLSPRGAMRSPRPTFSWLKIPSSTEYRIELKGHRVHYESLMRAEDAICADSFDDLDICSLPWPADRPDLPPGKTFSIEIATRRQISEPWRRSQSLEVRTPTLADIKTLEARLQRIDSMGWQGGARDAARAGLFAEAGMYTEAAEAYRRVLTAAPHPEFLITLADVYLMSGLLNRAEPRYRESLEEASPVIQAAAAFGLGRVEYARGRFREAALQFQTARALYAKLKLGDEEAAARHAAEKATARATALQFTLAPEPSVSIKGIEKKGRLPPLLCGDPICASNRGPGGIE